MKDAFKITCSALPDSTRVAGFRGSEGISRLYQFDVYLNVPTEGQDVDLADAVGAKATLEIQREGGGPPFAFHGVFAAFELLNQEGDNAHFHAVLVPQLWQLTQTLHSRIFTQKSIPDIIKAVLEDGGLGSDDYALQLSGSYKPEEHVCQYEESHFDFISRWMDREGMYYFFEQGDASEKLIITDKKSTHAELGDKPVRFHASFGGDTSAGEALYTLTCKHRALPAGVKLKDYDYLKPTLDVSGESAVSKDGLGEISAHGRRFFTPDDGKRLAKIRADELVARQVLYHGAGTAPYLRPGYTFKLEDHPRSAFEMQYLAIEVEHVGNDGIKSPELRRLTGIEGDRVYWVEVTAIPASVQFRAASKTPWPRIYGFENGTVCGPAESEYAQIDDQGRYKVKFGFDESDLKDGKGSTFVRMMQPHGGNPEGFHFPLRKGTEVVFSFLGGDPDRPVISGIVPNTTNPSPVIAKNHTQNVVQTGGLSRLEIEDQDGSQYIDISTPPEKTHVHLGAHHAAHQHNWIISTDGNGLVHTGGDRNITVGGVQTEDVKGDLTEDYHSNQTTHVYSAFKETIDAGATQTITSGETRTVSGGMKETISGGRTQTINGGSTETVNGDVTQTVSGSITQTVGGSVSETVTGGVTHTVTGALQQTITGGITTTTPATYKITATGGMQIMAPGGWTLIAPGGTRTVDQFFDKTGGKSTDAFAFKMSVSGIKMDICAGLSFGYSAINVAVTQVKVDVAAFKYANNPTKIETLGDFLQAGFLGLHGLAFIAMT